ncbi:glycerol-3-phosphate dehydrogenase/oxidase [Kistimonas asteriae]|uniref:glycerol-3-phosphate dehydrogenase/oxidase n=1 Tax=Kistimonas asteriae TaxID=517724 RepID=UPI001BAE115C|nr:glycerol-3-phosphate dehydrogenase/oxidase [Kistimonas asteriae]
MNAETRKQKRARLLQSPDVSVVIVGGGINGIGLYRELALQGVDVLLVEKEDYCSGASAAPSRMIHGGLRYLENGEFTLVRESLNERNRLLANAPHYVRPLPTTIPIFSRWDGVWQALLRFLRLSDKQSRRGAFVIKLGLMAYDLFTKGATSMPTHRFHRKCSTNTQWPALNKETVCSATYYDAWISYPERLAFELLADTEQLSDTGMALNYAELIRAEGDQLMIEDRTDGAQIRVKPRVVVNAAGAWIDFTNQAFSMPTQFIGGTKGSHLIINNRELYQATGGGMIYYENPEGRICILFPYFDNVLVGSTDISITNPDTAVCTAEETAYILESLKYIFPDITISHDEIVYRFSGVRPLPASDRETNGQISRDHSCRVMPASEDQPFPVYSMVGGKWTTFRSFAEQVADRVLADLDVTRQQSTHALAIGGGKDYPESDSEREHWCQQFSEKYGCSILRAEQLLMRYGTCAVALAEKYDLGNDRPLEHHTGYSYGELTYLIGSEQVVHLSDLLLRRTALAISGELNMAMVQEFNELLARQSGWSAEVAEEELSRTLSHLEKHHGLDHNTLNKRPSIRSEEHHVSSQESAYEAVVQAG